MSSISRCSGQAKCFKCVTKRTRQCFFRFDGLCNFDYIGCAFNYDGDFIITGSKDNTCRIWRA